ncbi:Uncharacterized protein conserved in archaea [Pelotomaculum thermopropionicum SI]|uniref:Uncharacterized protein conserved in archaea n=1 Tax=Pelotomaculum thermopropionicum (strain DSM 13744 / JCM 10971 / SI) TaxID=370438 RepID=A5D5B0_PELTS|nr:Uncharacterized protein conserved in archaea [Pelotomaculum thermopropionicum SI]
MRIAFFINTPAQAHTWRYIIENLIEDGHQVKILARNYDSAPVLLDKYGFDYEIYIEPGRYRHLRSLQIIPHVWHGYRLAIRFKPHIIIGFGIIEALTSFFLKKPCLVFTDSEPVPLQNYLNKLFSSVVLTPDCFNGDFGNKHIRIPGYKELAYLHPNYFQPDPGILNELGLGDKEKYIILRFNAFDAVHDIGRRGFSLSDKYKLVRELEKYARVFIRSEKKLPIDLEAYNLPISFDHIHHALYYAQLLVTDTQTMTTEAAILGTPAVRCNNFIGPDDMGNFIELEQKYGLIYNYREPDKAIEKAVELIQRPSLKEEWQQKREVLLKDKIDITAFMVWFIEIYPKSYKDIKQNPGLQYSFR